MSRPDDQCTRCLQMGHLASQCKQPTADARAHFQVLTLARILGNCRSEDAMDDDACMVWRYGTNSNGIPYAHHNGKVTNLRRLVWSLSHDGCEFPADMMASVRCLNTRCLNPSHILPMDRKGMQRAWSAVGVYSRPLHRHKRAEGRRNAACAKLTHDLAQQIRDRKGVQRARDVGSEFGVSKSLVHQIWQGKAWASPVVQESSVFAWRPA